MLTNWNCSSPKGAVFLFHPPDELEVEKIIKWINLQSILTRSPHLKNLKVVLVVVFSTSNFPPFSPCLLRPFPVCSTRTQEERVRSGHQPCRCRHATVQPCTLLSPKSAKQRNDPKEMVLYTICNSVFVHRWKRALGVQLFWRTKLGTWRN